MFYYNRIYYGQFWLYYYRHQESKYSKLKNNYMEEAVWSRGREGAARSSSSDPVTWSGPRLGGDCTVVFLSQATVAWSGPRSRQRHIFVILGGSGVFGAKGLAAAALLPSFDQATLARLRRGLGDGGMVEAKSQAWQHGQTRRRIGGGMV